MPHAKCLGFQLGVGGEEVGRRAILPCSRVEERVRWLARLPSGTGLRAVRYSRRRDSILPYWLTLLPTSGARSADGQRQFARLLWTPCRWRCFPRPRPATWACSTRTAAHAAMALGFLHRSRAFEGFVRWRGRRTWRRTWGWSGRAWTWRTAKSWARCHACTAAQGEPGMGGVSAGTATPGATALAARLWLRAAALGERILRAAAPEHEASADRCARILGVLRKKVPNHIALAAIKMVSNAIRTTWRMGERGAPCFCRKRRRRGFSSALHGLPCSSMCRQA